MKLAFKTFGDGPPFVLLHAFPLSGKMWNKQVAIIEDRGFKAILPDLRGFGGSHCQSEIYSIEEMAEDIFELLTDMRIGKAVIGGLSMGGYVALNLYRKHPGIFMALLLCDTTFTSDTEEKIQTRFDLIGQIEDTGSQALVDQMLPNLICGQTKENNKDLMDEIASFFAQTDPKASIAALRGMAGRIDHEHILERISVPTGLIFGEYDVVTNLDTAKIMAAVIPDSKLFIIRNAGHYSNLEQPEAFNSALSEFLDYAIC